MLFATSEALVLSGHEIESLVDALVHHFYGGIVIMVKCIMSNNANVGHID